MTIGSEFITELGRRGLVGAYFDFDGYRQLRRIDSFSELERFLRASGYDCSPLPQDIGRAVDILASEAAFKELRSPWTWVFMDPTGFLLILFSPFWIISWVTRKLNR